MQIKTFIDKNLEVAIEQNNIFCSLLKRGQWYSTQVNPILLNTENIQTKSGVFRKTTTTNNKHEYAYAVVTYYLSIEDLDTSVKQTGTNLSS